MNKHESCVYFLLKETFTEQRVWNMNYQTLMGFQAFLTKLLKVCEEKRKRYEED